MRYFERRPAPQAWVENETRWNQQWVDLTTRNPKARFAWYDHQGQSVRTIAIEELRLQTVAHCSFCDGFPVDGVSNETIEHFRPKRVGRFPQHAYTWSNLYYCCNACQTAKGEQWDDGLLAPDEAGYAFSHYFEFDFTTGAIRPAHGLDEATARRAAVTIRLYGLDTDARRRCRRLELNDWTSMETDKRQLDLRAYRDYLEP